MPYFYLILAVPISGILQNIRVAPFCLEQKTAAMKAITAFQVWTWNLDLYYKIVAFK